MAKFLCDTIPDKNPNGVAVLGVDPLQVRVSASDVAYAQRLVLTGALPWNDYVRTVLRFIDTPTGTILEETDMNERVLSYGLIQGEL